MSTPAAAARYVIVADDKTKATVASVMGGFKTMERGIKSTVRGINASLGLIAGYGINRAFQAVFTETAANSKEFALALDDVKRSAKGLLSADDGAPAATAAMKELAETLKDPALQKAADDLASTLIRGFGAAASGTAHFIAGLQVVTGTTGDEIEDLNNQIQDIDDTLRNLRGVRTGPNVAAQIAELQRQREALAQEQLAIFDRGPKPRGSTFGFDTFLPGGLPGFSVGDLNIADDIRKDMAEFQRIDNMIAGANDTLDAQLAEFVKSFEGEINGDILDTSQQAADSISEIGDRLGEDILGKAGELSVFAEQAARNMQSAFADFLFDPFEKGARGMLKGFVDILRRMAAEAAAAQIFDKIGGLGGVSGFLAGLFGSSASTSASTSGWSGPRYASGTDFVPHDQLALVHRGEAIIPAHANRGSSMTFAPVYNIDARGATQDLVKALPEVLKRNNEKLKAEIVSGLRSGKF